jgi:hypothetical protein
MNKLKSIIIDKEGISVYEAFENIFELADDGTAPAYIKEYCSKVMDIPFGPVHNKELCRKSWDKLNRTLTHKHKRDKINIGDEE